MKPGETQQFECYWCFAEIQLLYEPKVASGEVSGKNLRVHAEVYCPFCTTPLPVPEKPRKRSTKKPLH